MRGLGVVSWPTLPGRSRSRARGVISSSAWSARAAAATVAPDRVAEEQASSDPRRARLGDRGRSGRRGGVVERAVCVAAARSGVERVADIDQLAGAEADDQAGGGRRGNPALRVAPGSR